MRALFEKVTPPAQESFFCKEFLCPRFESPWHFHPECELTLIVESSGRRFVGDHIATFQEGDLVLLGPDLPHFWYSEPATDQRAHSVVTLFRLDFLGAEFLGKAELGPIRRLLAKAARGLQITGLTQKKLLAPIRKLPRLSGMPRLLGLLSVLDALARAPGRDLQPLSSAGFIPLLDPLDEPRMNRVLGYINREFGACHLNQPEAARLANLTPAAFSRFFKRKTGKSFSTFVNEVRVGHACKLLLESELNSTEICFASGFGNVSNFNRRFRKLKETTPSEYRREWRR